MLFPSPVKDSKKLGVDHKYVGGTYSANSNRKEVKEITKAAREFMQKHPDRSLGIATMNQTQKDLIEQEMDKVFVSYPNAQQYRDKWANTLESFFVKNLESVQGDERDAIFISTVYGPDNNGTVMQHFGPINRAGGHRRLNVLFTRAKKNMVVFTSLNPNKDIKISESSSTGIKALQGFLNFAAEGKINDGEETNLEPDSDFEIWVKEKLESIGCEVHPQVGVAGYRIDLGVKHPKYPYGYLIGIECDGATYHSSKSARERDIIRQQHLEGLGWNIYRIWSTDWFANPDQEFEKLKSYLNKLLTDTSSTDNESTPEVDSGTNPPTAEPEDEIKQEDLFETIVQDNNNEVVQLFDRVSYYLTNNEGKKEKRAVQIVPSHGSPEQGTIGQHSAIGRALLECAKGEEVECILPMGEASLEVIEITKHSH